MQRHACCSSETMKVAMSNFNRYIARLATSLRLSRCFPDLSIFLIASDFRYASNAAFKAAKHSF